MHLCMNDLNDGCLAMGEGITEKIFRVQVGIKPTTSVTTIPLLQTINFAFLHNTLNKVSTPGFQVILYI